MLEEKQRQQGLEKLLKSVKTMNVLQELKIGISPKVADAIVWLQKYLSSGPKSANDVYEAAANQGFGETTLKKAKSKLKVYSRLGYNPTERRNRWMWFYPQKGIET